jgi:hypothetical protein
MKIEISKKTSNELFIKFILPNNHFIIFNAEELTNNEGMFTIEMKNDQIFQEWLANRINKPTVDPDYYKLRSDNQNNQT